MIRPETRNKTAAQALDEPAKPVGLQEGTALLPVQAEMPALLIGKEGPAQLVPQLPG